MNPLKLPSKITLDVAKKFYPLLVSESGIWRKSLMRIQERFREASVDSGRLACVLTQSIVPEWPKRGLAPEPSEIIGMKSVGYCGGPSREPAQLFLRRVEGEATRICKLGELLQSGWQLQILEKSQKLRIGNAEFEPFVADSAIYDVNGNAVTYRDGQPVAVEAGCSRDLRIFVDSMDKLAVRDSYMAIARDAGKCLYGVPTLISRNVWQDWLEGFFEIDSDALWLNAIFELAWREIPGTPLTARKFAWKGTTRIPVDSLSHIRSTRDDQASLMAGTIDPSHWYSVIDDLFNSSIVAIDVLISIADGEIDIVESQKFEVQIPSMNANEFDIFLSHNSKDKPKVRQLKRALEKLGMRVWHDESELRPGLPWQDALEEIITTCKSAAVCVGESGIGPWEEPEMRALLRRFVSERKSGNIIPIIPVLLPGAANQLELPPFLEDFTWVDLRDGLAKEGLDRLVWGVTGRKNGKSADVADDFPNQAI